MFNSCRRRSTLNDINIYCTSLILNFKLMQTYNLEIPPERGFYGSIHKIHVRDWQCFNWSTTGWSEMRCSFHQVLPGDRPSAQLVEQLCSCNSPYVVDNLFWWIINKIKITLWIFRFCKGRELYINQKGSQRDVAHCAQIPLKLK